MYIYTCVYLHYIYIYIYTQNPNDKNETGQTPLHRAAMNGWLDCVSVLLEAGAHANASDVSGELYQLIIE